jgi:hypothetical protein
MKCECAQELIALDAYDELSDEQAHDLSQHLESCPRCKQELRAMHELVHALSLAPINEPHPNLLIASRLRLEEALDNLPPSGIFGRMRSTVAGSMTQLRMMPAMAALLVVAGAALGASAMHTYSARGAAPEVAGVATPLAPSALSGQGPDSANIANISNVESQPGTNNVSVEYNRLVPAHFEGSLEDPETRRLLVAAAQSGEDPSVQDNSVRLLADECRAGHQCTDGPIRSALLNALRHDSDAGVRAQALLGLEPYVVNDQRVRDAVLEAMMHDSSPVVRADAIRIIQPVQGDSVVRLVLHRMASQEKNPSLRTASRQVLSEAPEVQ